MTRVPHYWRARGFWCTCIARRPPRTYPAVRSGLIRPWHETSLVDLTEATRAGSGKYALVRPDPVPSDLIHRVLDNARFAPSGAGTSTTHRFSRRPARNPPRTPTPITWIKFPCTW